eukprot:15448089-Alexandrium_andersonii.AAC.1
MNMCTRSKAHTHTQLHRALGAPARAAGRRERAAHEARHMQLGPPATPTLVRLLGARSTRNGNAEPGCCS